MRIAEAVELLEQSDVYKTWRKGHPKAFLVHAFCLRKDGLQSEWQLGYYVFTKDTMFTFFIQDPIKVSPESEVFKHPEAKVLRLDPYLVEAQLDQVLEKCGKLIESEYKGQIPDQTIVILQHLEGLGQVWNITFVTKQLHTLNIKVDAKSAEVKEHKLTNIFSFVQEDS